MLFFKIAIIIHADRSRGGTAFTSVCLCACLFLPHDISEIDATKITKLDKEIFRDKSWKLIYFGVKRSKIRVTDHKNTAGVGLCTLVSAGFFYFYVVIITPIKLQLLNQKFINLKIQVFSYSHALHDKAGSWL